ncbi:phosphatase PAP2 family protein [Bacillus thermotolerans]|uniref:Membrane-associated phospholipid phosphatase n=1 Tax=Bacillus thermotolerans TaxID=1221996 RepID=A0A0F5I670_BACTR|nr:phosphatase PAP2 family protein [Bacillus thermotolerans]KKB37995.1 Membrane-associated phospholipid phosphatase [Bacillus thermotolerans]KKB40657.1 Membrane-associated phospholipid phosphatase [Bacillus thermotolerans]KKB43808.1 Membrane-associated phospholipid phosphatase [Bacillus thermotolerans]
MRTVVFGVSLMILAILMGVTGLPAVEAFDRQVIFIFEAIRTKFLTGFFIFFTELGSFKVLFPFALVLSIIGLWRKRYWEALFIMIVFWTVRGANRLLKELFERERPSFGQVVEAGGYSFPSGHAMNSTAFLLFLLYLLIHMFKLGRKHSLVWTVVTVTVIILIALSRVYLGVHYLTDIIAGISAGLVIVLLLISLYERLTGKKTSWKEDRKLA